MMYGLTQRIGSTLTINNEFSKYIIDGYNGLVKQIANEYHRKYPMVSREDIAQELWLWFWEHPNKTIDWIKLDDKDADKLFARSLRNQAIGYCAKEKARALGFETIDNFYYHRDLVEQFLPLVIEDRFEQPADYGESIGKVFNTSEPSTGGNWMSYLADVFVGFKKLTADQQAILVMKYGPEQLGHEQIAEQYKISTDNARMRVNRALRAIIFKLGGSAPHTDEDYIESSVPKEEIHVDDSNA
jgi:DNA-directed RNA polymerase specialized sigma24 family protein